MTDTRLKRSETIFVKSVQCERRREILKSLYHDTSSSFLSWIFDSIHFASEDAANFCVLGYVSNVVGQPLPLSESKSQAVAMTVCFGVATLWSLILSIDLFRHGQRPVALISLLKLLGDVGLTVCMSLYLTLDSKIVVPALCLAFTCAEVAYWLGLQIYFKSTAGLYAPAAPSRHAPTVLPIFALNELAAILLAVSFGFEMSRNSTVLKSSTIVREVAFGLSSMVNWGEIGVVVVSRRNANLRQHKRLKREQDIFIMNQARDRKQGSAEQKMSKVKEEDDGDDATAAGEPPAVGSIDV